MYVLLNSESVQWHASFSFLITWRSTSSKTATVYKISWKCDDFSLRYGDISIFKMAAVRHLVIALPLYETTHEVSVAGRWPHACQISCQSYLGPQNGGFGGFWTPKCYYSSSRPPKGTSLRKSASVKLSTVKIRWGVWPRRVDRKCDRQTDTHTHTQVNLYSVHA